MFKVDDNKPAHDNLSMSNSSVGMSSGKTAMSRSAFSKMGSLHSSLGSFSGGAFAVGDRFHFVSRIGAGAFGQVFQGIDLTNNRNVAVKIEKRGFNHPQLDTEVRVYKLLNREPKPGVPAVYYRGNEGLFYILVMDLLGPNIEDLLAFCEPRFSLKTLFMLSLQMLQCIKNLHDIGYIHRDIKPENFTMGIGGLANHVYLVDFGLARKYTDNQGKHIPFKAGKGFTGTARYASTCAHLGQEQSRRDDMESFSYVLAILGNGSLPWQGVRASDRVQKKRIIQQMKIQNTVTDIMGSLPKCFHDIATHIKGLKFDERPDYEWIKTSLHQMAEEHSIQLDFHFDWFDRATPAT